MTTPLNVFQFRMPAGIPGNVERAESAVIDAAPLDATNYPTAYGVPVLIDATSGNLRKVIAGDTGASVTGFYVRPFPTQGNGTDGLGTTTPPTSGIADRLLRGFIDVALNGTAPAKKDGAVYVRVANASTGKPIGGLEAAQETAATSAAKSGGNTGNGTFVLDATTPVLANAVPGVYTLRCTVAGTNSATFRLVDPAGRVLGDFAFSGSGATVTVADQIKGVITDGATDFVVGDGFDVTVAFNTSLIPGAFFEGAADGYGNTVVRYNP